MYNLQKIGYIFDLFELLLYDKSSGNKNRVNLQYKKNEDSVLLSLFMRTYLESASIITHPSTGLSSIPLETNIPEGPIHEKYQQISRHENERSCSRIVCP